MPPRIPYLAKIFCKSKGRIKKIIHCNPNTEGNDKVCSSGKKRKEQKGCIKVKR